MKIKRDKAYETPVGEPIGKVVAFGGEVLGSIYHGDRIIPGQEHRQSDLDEREYREIVNRTGKTGEEALAEMETIRPVISQYSKLSREEFRAVFAELSASERQVLHILSAYVAYKSNLIRFDNRKEIQTSHMSEMTGLCLRTVEDAVRMLVSKNIIYKGRNGRGFQYFMNPWIVSYGVRINHTLQQMFKHYRIRTKGGVTWDEYERSGRGTGPIQ